MIINLTQHPASPEQKEQGVADLKQLELEALKELLTFEKIPNQQELEKRAEAIAELAAMNGLPGDPWPNAAMIGGAPYLMAHLEKALDARFIEPVYAFSKRESVEQVKDGKVIKVAIFRHMGFVK